MDRRKFLKPFAATVATLVASTQAQASLETKTPTAISAPRAVPSPGTDLVLEKSHADIQLAQHSSHSSHASHSSHSSHSSSSF